MIFFFSFLYRFSVISSIESPKGMAAGLHTSLQYISLFMLPYFFPHKVPLFHRSLSPFLSYFFQNDSFPFSVMRFRVNL